MSKCKDLVDLLLQMEFYSPIFGFSLTRKITPPATFVSRYLHLGSFFFIMAIEVTVINLVSEKNERILLLGGDLLFIMVNKQRALVSLIDVCYVNTAAIMLIFFYLDDYRWLIEANNDLQELKIYRPTEKIRKLGKRTRIWTFLFPLATFLAILIVVGAALAIFQERNQKFGLWAVVPSSIFITIWHYNVNLCIIQFLIRCYIMIVFSEQLYEQLNVWAREQNRKNRNRRPAMLRTFEIFYAEFCSTSIIFNKLRNYIRIYFTMFVIGTIPITILFLYIPLYRSDVNTPIRVLFGLFLPVYMGIIVGMAFRIAKISNAAKRMEDVWFRCLMMEIQSPSREGSSSELITKQYFHTVWKDSLGVIILGVKINFNSIISMLIVYLTILAMVVSNINSFMKLMTV